MNEIILKDQPGNLALFKGERFQECPKGIVSEAVGMADEENIF